MTKKCYYSNISIIILFDFYSSMYFNDDYENARRELMKDNIHIPKYPPYRVEDNSDSDRSCWDCSNSLYI